MHKGLILVLVIFVISSLTDALGVNKFYNESKRGWFWFEEDKKEEKVVITEEAAKLVIERQKEELDNARSLALASPTPENVAAYMRLEGKMWEQAKKLYHAQEMARFMYPELMSLDKNPVNVPGVRIKREIEEKTKKEKINLIGSKFSFVLFTKESCPYCEAFEPLLKDFATKYNLSIEAVGESKYFEIKNARGLAEKLNIKSTPTVIAVHNTKPIVFELTRGFMTFNELEEVFVLAEKYLREQNYEI
jgi:conjugal transfer pilus assembly protein TraF